MSWSQEQKPAPQAVIEKDGWKVTLVAYPVEAVQETAALLLYGE